jgi:hypothetical protein
MFASTPRSGRQTFARFCAYARMVFDDNGLEGDLEPLLARIQARAVSNSVHPDLLVSDPGQELAFWAIVTPILLTIEVGATKLAPVFRAALQAMRRERMAGTAGAMVSAAVGPPALLPAMGTTSLITPAVPPSDLRSGISYSVPVFDSRTFRFHDRQSTPLVTVGSAGNPVRLDTGRTDSAGGLAERWPFAGGGGPTLVGSQRVQVEEGTSKDDSVVKFAGKQCKSLDKKAFVATNVRGFASRMAKLEPAIRLMDEARLFTLFTKDLRFEMPRIRAMYLKFRMTLVTGAPCPPYFASLRKLDSISDLSVVTSDEIFEAFLLFLWPWDRPQQLSLKHFLPPDWEYEFWQKKSTPAGHRAVVMALSNVLTAIEVFFGEPCEGVGRALFDTLRDDTRMCGVPDCYVFCLVNQAISDLCYSYREEVPAPEVEARLGPFYGRGQFARHLDSVLTALVARIPQPHSPTTEVQAFLDEIYAIIDWHGTAGRPTKRPFHQSGDASSGDEEGSTSLQPGGTKGKKKLRATRGDDANVEQVALAPLYPLPTARGGASAGGRG